MREFVAAQSDSGPGVLHQLINFPKEAYALTDKAHKSSGSFADSR